MYTYVLYHILCLLCWTTNETLAHCGGCCYIPLLDLIWLHLIWTLQLPGLCWLGKWSGLPTVLNDRFAMNVCMNLFWQLLLLLAHSQKTSSNMYANLPFREDVINERTGGCVVSLHPFPSIIFQSNSIQFNPIWCYFLAPLTSHFHHLQPSEVCHNLDINTIPYILGHVSPGFVTDRKHSLYDQAKTRHCLRGKNILILGDSVSEEMTFDLATLISSYDTFYQ